MAMKRLYWPENWFQMVAGVWHLLLTHTSEAEPSRPVVYTVSATLLAVPALAWLAVR